MLRPVVVSFLVLFLMVGYQFSWSQPVLTHHFDMDNCSLDDNTGRSDGFLFGPDPCGCGVSSNGLELDGNVHFGEFTDAITQLLAGDWTMSFYIHFDNTESAGVDIFSLAINCSRDSSFFIRYFPSVGQLSVLLSDSPNNEVELRAALPENLCWHYLAVTKMGAVLKLYINGELADEGAAVSPISLNVNDNLSLANGPCLLLPNNADVRFRGRIDELRFYDRALSDRELSAADFKPDQIVTSDTTIFIGESVALVTGGTCADDFIWSPSTGLNDAMAINPVASPEISTTYTFTANDDDCSVTDQVRINVVTSDELQCSDLLLPSAFTPNGDGINDFYGLSNSFLVERLISLEIFNKWGGRVFFTDDINGIWDGIYKDLPAPPTSYVYRVIYFCEGSEYMKTGVVNVLR